MKSIIPAFFLLFTFAASAQPSLPANLSAPALMDSVVAQMGQAFTLSNIDSTTFKRELTYYFESQAGSKLKFTFLKQPRPGGFQYVVTRITGPYPGLVNFYKKAFKVDEVSADTGAFVNVPVDESRKWFISIYPPSKEQTTIKFVMN